MCCNIHSTLPHIFKSVVRFIRQDGPEVGEISHAFVDAAADERQPARGVDHDAAGHGKAVALSVEALCLHDGSRDGAHVDLQRDHGRPVVLGHDERELVSLRVADEATRVELEAAGGGLEGAGALAEAARRGVDDFGLARSPDRLGAPLKFWPPILVVRRIILGVGVDPTAKPAKVESLKTSLEVGSLT